MDLINELSYLISSNKNYDLNSFLPPESKIRKLYDLVISDQMISNEEAAQHIYNSSKSAKKYLMLKRNLVKKLSDMVFLQEYKNHENENYKTIGFQAEKELIVAKKLLYHNVYHNPYRIISKIITRAHKHYLIDIEVNATQSLRTIYALKGFPKETGQCDKRLNELIPLQNIANKSKGMWEMLSASTKYTNSQTLHTLSNCQKYATQIQQYLVQYDSPFLKLHLCFIKILEYKQSNLYLPLLEQIQKFERLLNEHPSLKTKKHWIKINYEYAYYYYSTKQLDTAQKHITKCLNVCDYRAFDKFEVQILHFNIVFKMNKQIQAKHIIQEVYATKQFELLNTKDKAIWAINQIYLKISKSKKHYDKSPELQLGSDDFTKQTKGLATDKYGYNIILQITKLLLTLLENKVYCDNLGNNMLTYYHRYVQDIHCLRTKKFFHLLSKAAASDFNQKKTEEFKTQFHNQIKTLHLNYFSCYEILPYEEVWKLILQRPLI
jgi:hypothetical protein